MREIIFLVTLGVSIGIRAALVGDRLVANMLFGVKNTDPAALMTFSVNRREREVGIRMALGAARHDVLLLILKNASWLVIWGLAFGLACTLAERGY